MTDSELDPSALEKWDPHTTEHVVGILRPVVKKWFRSEVRGLDSIPHGGALLVCNHSGGTTSMDVPIFAVDFYEKFGYDRPVYTLSHDVLFQGKLGDYFRRTGIIPATRENAAEALRSGGVVIVFPGGDYDAFQPTSEASTTIDFAGRRGYVRTALEAGVPIVPAVSIGGQETHLFLSRGEGLARKLRLDKLLRIKTLPISLGFPFGISALLPVNLPLPSKIVVQVLDPIDPATKFGKDPDIEVVDDYVRQVMQDALVKLAAERRYPLLG